MLDQEVKVEKDANKEEKNMDEIVKDYIHEDFFKKSTICKVQVINIKHK